MFIAVYRWLAKDEDDGLIVRELPLGGTSLLNSAFYLQLICCYYSVDTQTVKTYIFLHIVITVE